MLEAGIGNCRDDYDRKMGVVASLMACSPKYCHFPIACLTHWIAPAIIHEQIHFFSARSAGVVGYVTWALLAEETEERLVNDPEVLLHLSEWNEGERLWIFDFLILRGNVRHYILETKKLFRGKYGEARSMRRTEDGSIRKVTIWSAT